MTTAEKVALALAVVGVAATLVCTYVAYRWKPARTRQRKAFDDLAARVSVLEQASVAAVVVVAKPKARAKRTTPR